MRTVILSFLLLLLQSLSAIDVAAFMNEPDGFWGVTWGAPLDKHFTQDDFVGFSSDEKSSKYQVLRDSVPLEVDNVRLYGMVFSFFKGVAWKVDMEARLLQAGKLLELFRVKYGEPSRVTDVSQFTKEHAWSGEITDISLVTSLNFYDGKTIDIATASLQSKKIKSQLDDKIEPVVTEQKLPIDAIAGFRDRKWGSGLNKALTYLPLEQEPFYEYLIKGDDMVFEGVYAREIRYRFHNNRALQKVELHFSGRQNYLKLKEACFKLFGTTSRFEQGEIRWIGRKTTASLSLTIDAKGTWLSKLNLFGFGTQ